MKIFVKILFIAILSLFLFSQIVSAQDSIINEPSIGVRQLMVDADQYPDHIVVQGIVSKVFPQDHLIGLIDNLSAKDCNPKTCKTPCPLSDSKKSTDASVKNCPMTAMQDHSRDTAAKCPMAGTEAYNKISDNAFLKECPMKAANDGSKKCPVNADKKRDKVCPMAAAKDCQYRSGKECAKSCGDTLILPVQWKGDMPDPSDEIRVAGKIIRQDGRLLFLAESIKVMSD